MSDAVVAWQQWPSIGDDNGESDHGTKVIGDDNGEPHHGKK